MCASREWRHPRCFAHHHTLQHPSLLLIHGKIIFFLRPSIHTIDKNDRDFSFLSRSSARRKRESGTMADGWHKVDLRSFLHSRAHSPSLVLVAAVLGDYYQPV